jgi:hypothetical protein
MNPFCEKDFIGVVSTGDDACVIGVFTMEADEVAAVEGYYGTLLFRGKCKDLVIWNSLVCFVGFLDCQYVMAQTPEVAGRKIGELLIGIDISHGLRILIFLNCLRNFDRMHGGIGPAIG